MLKNLASKNSSAYTSRLGSYLTENIKVSLTETSRLTLFRLTVSLYCENHMKHINIPFGQNAEFFL
jgi:hypothetical protein